MMATQSRPRQVPPGEQSPGWAQPSHQHGRDTSYAASSGFAYDAAATGNYETAGSLGPNNFLMDQMPNFGDPPLLSSPFSGPELALDTSMQSMDFPRSQTDDPWTGMHFMAQPLAQSYQGEQQSFYQPSMSNTGSQSHYALSDPGEYGAAYNNETTPVTSQQFIAPSETEDDKPHHGYVNPQLTQSSKPASVTSAATSQSNKRKLSDLICEACDAPCRNESEYKKHKARHDKMHTCPVPECENGKAGKGFTTPNDLERHMGSKHKIFLPDTKLKVYNCQARGCESKNRLWPRYDNFKQHIERMHDPSDVEDIIARSQVDPPLDEKSHYYKRILDARNAAHMRSESSSTASSLHQSFGPSPGTTRARSSLTRSASAKAAMSGSSLHLTPTTNQYLGVPRSRRKSEASSTASNSRASSPAAPAQYRNRSATVGNTKPHLQTTGTHGFWPSMPGIVVSPSPDERSPEDGVKSTPFAFGTDVGIVDGVKPSFIWSQSGADANVDLSLLDAAGDPDEDEPASPLSFPRSHSSHQIRCRHEGCGKAFTRVCDLKKHSKRHQRPYGCTFDGCNKSFGSKNDWKRHENGQHLQQETWRCPLPLHGVQAHDGKVLAVQQCAQLFDDDKDFSKHIRGQHGSRSQAELNQLVEQSHIGANGQQSFWCGFCQKIVRLQEVDIKAWDERFNHIGDHFKDNQIENWLVCGDHRTKKQVSQGEPDYARCNGALSSPSQAASTTERIEVALGSVAITCIVCLNGPFSELHACCPHCGTPF